MRSVALLVQRSHTCGPPVLTDLFLGGLASSGGLHAAAAWVQIKRPSPSAIAPQPPKPSLSLDHDFGSGLDTLQNTSQITY